MQIRNQICRLGLQKRVFFQKIAVSSRKKWISVKSKEKVQKISESVQNQMIKCRKRWIRAEIHRIRHQNANLCWFHRQLPIFFEIVPNSPTIAELKWNCAEFIDKRKEKGRKSVLNLSSRADIHRNSAELSVFAQISNETSAEVIVSRSYTSKLVLN